MQSQTQSHADSEQIRKFAQELGKFSNHVESFDTTITAELRRLGDTFRDPGYDDFVAAFQHSRKLLMKFLEEARTTIPELSKDADAIELSANVKINP